MSLAHLSLDLSTLQEGYLRGVFSISEVIEESHRRISKESDQSVWIYRRGIDELRDRVEQVNALFRGQPDAFERFPLLGIPYAVKDNMDVKGLPTTAGCPAFAYTAGATAPVIERIEEAGGILMGKTNLDQLATGLTGTRSPYGACRNVFNPEYIAGGSSSGSAVAVASGQVTFALGTDTAGSIRVPAAFNNIVGLKPTRGRLSTRGVVPACRSIDCVSVLALTCEDARKVYEVAEAYDPEDVYSDTTPAVPEGRSYRNGFRFGRPQESQLEFYGNREYAGLYREAVARLRDMGGEEVTIDFEPFMKVGHLLYRGPWVTERLAQFEDFLRTHADQVLPVTLQIIKNAERFSAVDAFRAAYALREYRREVEPTLAEIDSLCLPTAATIYSLREIEEDPILYNANLGYYANFVNLLNLSAVSLPSGFQHHGLPFGVTIIAPAYKERWLLELGAEFHARTKLCMGATARTVPPAA